MTFRTPIRLSLPPSPAIYLAAIALLSCRVAGATIQLPGIFDDNMVVQRGRPVPVWGTADPNAKVEVRLGPRTGNATADAAGRWQVTLGPVEAGGPYLLQATSGGATKTLTNVLAGDVWLCSGQSNMQLPVKEVSPLEQEAELADRPNLRLCSVPKVPSAKPLATADIHWRLCTPATAREFSAVAYFFACELLKDPALADVPLGIVDSSFGGTTCEGWIPQPALTKFDAKDLHDSLFGIKPANLYNGMIAPLGHTAFKGVVWYQGESNSAHPATYPALLETMIAEWRQQFGEPELPFFVVQLPEYANLWEGFYWPWIREMQARAVQSIPHTALVVGIDTTDGFNLHPKEKLEIGRRAALLARRTAYGEDIVASGPEFKSATVAGSTMRVRFETAHDGLASTTSNGVAGFALAGADGKYYFADATIEGDSVVVKSEHVPHAETVRYAWDAVPHASLVNRSGLPAAPFRTDTLPYTNVELQKQQITRRVATSAYEVVINADGMPVSLIVHGAQFLSNEPGMAGGGSIPGFWGPRELIDIRELGPRLLTCRDEEVTLQMAFDEASMDWTLINAGKEPITFQLALSPCVKAPGAITNNNVTLARGNAVLNLDGFDSITNTATGAVVSCRIDAGARKSITLK